MISCTLGSIDILRADVDNDNSPKAPSLSVAWNGNAFDLVYQSQQGKDWRNTKLALAKIIRTK